MNRQTRHWIYMCLLMAVTLLFVVGVWALLPPSEDAALQASGEREIRLPILMYHSIQEDGDRQGRYVLPASTLEADLQYLSKHGYTAVTVADLIAYVDEGTPLPEKPVMLTFDDGFYNNVVYVLPLLEKYDMKAVVSVVGKYSENAVRENDPNPRYAYLTWDEMRQAQQSGRIEIQNHSYDMHGQGARTGANKKRGEGYEEYRAALYEDVGKMQTLLQENAGIQATAFAYPLGAMCDDSEKILKEMGFRATFSCYEKVNYISKDPKSLYALGRFNRPSSVSTEQFMKQIAY